VNAWHPYRALLFHDTAGKPQYFSPDGQSLEFIGMLDDVPRPELGQISWSDWRRQA
jgi:hypothetical protein